METRLHSALAQLPLKGLPPRLLNAGCGAFPAARTLRAALPGWALYGLDLDDNALRAARQRTPGLHLIQADVRDLPALLKTTFGLILVRHPDLYGHRAAWAQTLPQLPCLFAPGGIMLITLYAPEEVDVIRTLALPHAYPLNGLAAVDLAGHDRYVLAFNSSDA